MVLIWEEGQVGRENEDAQEERNEVLGVALNKVPVSKGGDEDSGLLGCDSLWISSYRRCRRACSVHLLGPRCLRVLGLDVAPCRSVNFLTIYTLKMDA